MIDKLKTEARDALVKAGVLTAEDFDDFVRSYGPRDFLPLLREKSAEAEDAFDLLCLWRLAERGAEIEPAQAAPRMLAPRVEPLSPTVEAAQAALDIPTSIVLPPPAVVTRTPTMTEIDHLLADLLDAHDADHRDGTHTTAAALAKVTAAVGSIAEPTVEALRAQAGAAFRALSMENEATWCERERPWAGTVAKAIANIAARVRSPILNPQEIAAISAAAQLIRHLTKNGTAP